MGVAALDPSYNCDKEHTMHSRIIPAILGIAVAAGATLPAAAQDMPKRKSGLWEITMDSSAPKGAPPRTMTQCVDAAKDDLARQAGQQMQAENKCSTTNMKQSAGRMSFDSACDFGTMKLASQTMISGDFNTSYKMVIKSKFDPPMMGMADSTTTMDAKYVGACKPGQRPGDTTMPGAPTMNVYDMMDGKKK